MLNPIKTIALLGGNEFTANCVNADTKILEVINKDKPTIQILPTANVHHPDIAAQNGISYFETLGYTSNRIMVTNLKEANNQNNLGQLSDCDLLYLPGGNPQHLFQSLLNSKLLQEIITRSEQGMVIAGSSAGAMVMGELLKNPPQGTWSSGLGLIPNLGIIPHHENVNHLDTHNLLLDTVLKDNPHAIIYGISIESGCIVKGNSVSVIGNDDLIRYSLSGYASCRVNESIEL
ncbi:MAG: Type 1 glutamine amidotransferase-like domain-containing protein [Dehalococcoidia bacterium]